MITIIALLITSASLSRSKETVWKCSFNDCEFGCFEPHTDFEYEAKKYRTIEVACETEKFGHETHIIAERELCNAIMRNDDSYTDNQFSYYADDNDDVYAILENITGEEVS